MTSRPNCFGGTYSFCFRLPKDDHNYVCISEDIWSKCGRLLYTVRKSAISAMMYPIDCCYALHI